MLLWPSESKVLNNIRSTTLSLSLSSLSPPSPSLSFSLSSFSPLSFHLSSLPSSPLTQGLMEGSKAAGAPELTGPIAPAPCDPRALGSEVWDMLFTLFPLSLIVS